MKRHKEKRNCWFELMKVALISSEGGGISSVCYGLAYNLAKRKISTTVFTGTSENRRIVKMNEYLNVMHLPFFDFPPRNVWFQLRNFRLLSKTLRDYTLVHGVSPGASAIFSFFKRKLKKPFVATIHTVYRGALRAFMNTPLFSWSFSDFGFHVLEHPWHEFVVRACLANSDHIVACSFNTFDGLRANYKNLPTDRVSVICNGINFEEIDGVEIRDENKNDGNSLSIVFAARLFWLKGAIYALRALKLLTQDFRDLRMKVFGKGPEEYRIKKFISNAGLENNVLFQGFVPHRNLMAEIKKSDLVVVPSLYEAQPMVALEAMACKKPVVAFDVPFAREIIEDGHNGLLAQAYDVQDLSYKIRLLLSDKKLRLGLGQNAYKYVKREHNWDTQAEKYLEVYKNAIARIK